MAYGMSVKSPTGDEMISGYEVNNISTVIGMKQLGWNTVTLPALGAGQYYKYMVVNGAEVTSPFNWTPKPDSISISGNILKFQVIDSANDPGLGNYVTGFSRGQGIVIVGGRI